MASIGKRGGERISQNREHMASIGKKGGERVSQNIEHMSSIGRKGGEAVSRDREHMSQIGARAGNPDRQMNFVVPGTAIGGVASGPHSYFGGERSSLEFIAISQVMS